MLYIHIMCMNLWIRKVLILLRAVLLCCIYTLWIRIFEHIESVCANNEFQFSTSFTLDVYNQKTTRNLYARAEFRKFHFIRASRGLK